MLVAKTSIQVAIAEGITSELIELLTQFIMKYHHNTGLNIKEVHHSILHLNDEIQQESSSVTIKDSCWQPLVELDSCDILKISNPEYHKLKGHSLKWYKSSNEENIQHISLSFKTCNYYLEKGYNIRSCIKHKADKENYN